MADQTPSDDPLGNRLRAIFAAEHADIERHQVVPDPATNPAPFQKWIRFAMATALIAIAGVVFISNRSNERALEPEVAAQILNDKILIVDGAILLIIRLPFLMVRVCPKIRRRFWLYPTRPIIFERRFS